MNATPGHVFLFWAPTSNALARRFSYLFYLLHLAGYYLSLVHRHSQRGVWGVAPPPKGSEKNCTTVLVVQNGQILCERLMFINNVSVNVTKYQI